jgi:protoporphyrin/coproporphyrin ferrochelatase
LKQAVLLIAFGGPERPEEIRPFLRHVLAGRPVPASRLEEVAHHYEAIGGRSPLNELTRAQGAALSARLAQQGASLPVELGMWHAPPFIADALRGLAESGVRRVIAVVMAALHDEATLARYRAVVDSALRELPELELVYADSPETSEGFLTANADQIRAAFERLAAQHPTLAPEALLVFTAHSVPTAVGQASGYVQRYTQAAERIAQRLGISDYRLGYQSRSGNPTDAWLEPDIGVVVREEAAQGRRALVLAPIGFVSDHVEVLYDLDVEAAQIAEKLGVVLARAQTVTTHAGYIDALAQTVAARL